MRVNEPDQGESVVFGIFTKPVHVEKIVNYLNQETDLKYVISTNKYELNALRFDVGVSYCFPHVIDVDSPAQAERQWYNYHPAPLPDYKGMNCYSFAIRDRVTVFGVTLHVMTRELDSGPTLRIRRFNLDSEPVNTSELGSITHYYLFQLFRETIESLAFGPKSKSELDAILGARIGQ